MKKKKKSIEPICRNCLLYDAKQGVCRVVVLYAGERIHVPVEPDDRCFFEEEYFNPVTNQVEKYSDDIKHVRFWVEDENGQPTDGDGIVKIEYPEGFFGPNVD